ncbi:MAG: WhiB family transcriptional regulator [Actinomycetota bacterium]
MDLDQTPGPGSWILRAACAGLPTHYFFGDTPNDTGVAVAVCQTCSVRKDCAAYALATPVDGVWGGLTEADRHLIPRRDKCNTERRLVGASTGGGTCLTQSEIPASGSKRT